MKIITILTMLILTSGCALLDSSAGRAKYTIKPIVFDIGDGKQAAACCEISIFNTKDINELSVSGEYDPATGKLKFTLGQSGVDASGPISQAVKNQEVIIERLGKVIEIVGKNALIP